MKHCYRCKLNRPLSDFHRDASKKDGRVGQCKECRKNNPLTRKNTLWSAYKLTVERFDEILENQGGVCAICENVGQWRVDHDHACCPGKRSCGECVRGILCHMCNIHLGFFEKNADTSRLTKYLEG